MTDAVDSGQANRQTLGRLRDLESDEQSPEFLYLVCADIDKHKEYHENKMQKFKGWVRNHRESLLPHVL